MPLSTPRWIPARSHQIRGNITSDVWRAWKPAFSNDLTEPHGDGLARRRRCQLCSQIRTPETHLNTSPSAPEPERAAFSAPFVSRFAAGGFVVGLMPGKWSQALG